MMNNWHMVSLQDATKHLFRHKRTFCIFLPFLLRSIAASKRTSNSPFGKTGTTQRGLGVKQIIKKKESTDKPPYTCKRHGCCMDNVYLYPTPRNSVYPVENLVCVCDCCDVFRLDGKPILKGTYKVTCRRIYARHKLSD